MNSIINMSRTSLIITDAIFVIVGLVSYQNGDLKTYPIILGPLMLVALTTCVIRHINYYHITKRIY
jgi:ABC-type microcin C transport system permease subunit YejB